MNNTPYLEEVFLRAPEPEDLDVMFSIENDAELWKVGTATGPYSRYQLRRYIAESQNDLFLDRQLRLMVVHPVDGVIAIADLCSFDPRHNRAEVGIVVRSDKRHAGIGRRALQLLEIHSFGLLGIHQLYAYIAADNLFCQSIFRHEGYMESGCFKHWLRTADGYKDVFLFQKISSSVE
ncbi:GNAT family N-acetyltransferase [uncultured Phocaeicola sp.]|jgi:diamine N-acetyltransferase|uniref:GNAT family N-acetyltransferase n=1 Tax=uncultured Phocaeicola sp. TaxID=990718 RepID=UPI0015AA3AEB|nr:GNAT family N-acetyltransferase [uncultured Phocaeicola sp.]